MARAATDRRRRRPTRPPLEQGPRTLRFEDEGRRDRIGDQRPAHEVRDEFPPQREATAGMSGGAMPGNGVTADDLSPETLLDDDPSHTPDDPDREAADAQLRVADESEVGLGSGLDEAELAKIDPVGSHGTRKGRKG